MARFKAGCLQLNASNDLDRNIAATGDLVRRARDQGADFISTPEVSLLIEAGRKNTVAKAHFEAEHPGLEAFRGWARETGAWLHVGSLTVKLEDDERLANRGFLIDPDGTIVASYDKIHMFDVNVDDGNSYRESRSYRPGGEAVLADLPWGRLGLSICYDLRFPHLYRELAKAGADFLVIPSAFTRPTGRAHWHVLQRARAIETGCYVISAAQCGQHAGGRKTYGHSIIVDPWGAIVAEAEEDVGIILAEIDSDQVVEARQRVPSLEHDRDYSGPHLKGGVAKAAE